MLLSEWSEQKGVVLAFPEEDTDWSAYLEEARLCVVSIVEAIIGFEPVYLLCKEPEICKKYFVKTRFLHFIQANYNDTWMRDCIALSTSHGYVDFTFTGWGGKFDAHLDNQLNTLLNKQGVLIPMKKNDFILEGGSIESDGKGTVLTTSLCLHNPNRNSNYSKEDVEVKLHDTLGIDTVLWLENGELAGDDTDGHIDTLARFCNEHTIAYVGTPHKEDEHYASLHSMQEELKAFNNYTLVALPFVPAQYYEGERLPATYANFLIINGAVLVPTYGVKEDEQALEILKNVFTDRKVIGLDCQVLIRQHGSLHCMTMQLGALK